MTKFTHSLRIACFFLVTAFTAKGETPADRISAAIENIEKQITELKSAWSSRDKSQSGLVAFCTPLKSDIAPLKNPEKSEDISQRTVETSGAETIEKTSVQPEVKKETPLESAPKLKPDFLRRMVLSTPATSLKQVSPKTLGTLMKTLENASKDMSGKKRKRYDLAIKALKRAGATSVETSSNMAASNLALKDFVLAIPASFLSRSARKILNEIKKIFEAGKETEAMQRIDQALKDKA